MARIEPGCLGKSNPKQLSHGCSYNKIYEQRREIVLIRNGAVTNGMKFENEADIDANVSLPTFQFTALKRKYSGEITMPSSPRFYRPIR